MSGLCVFDFDDTVAMTEQHLVDPFLVTLYKYVSDHGAKVSFEDFCAESHKLYAQHGSTIHVWQNLLGKDMQWTIDGFDFVAETNVRAVKGNVPIDLMLPEKFHALQQRGHTLAILTLSHRNYALPVLKYLGLGDIFPEEMVFDISVVNGHLKRSEEAYRHVLNSLSDKVFLHHHMVEDSPANLPAAKRMGFTTWLVGGKPPKEEHLPLIDHRHRDIHGVLDAMLAA